MADDRGEQAPDERARLVLEVIRSRRAVRDFAPRPVAVDAIRQVVDAARWASSASNRRIHRFLVVRDQGALGLIRALSPGMLSVPPALIVVCTDRDKARLAGVKLEADPTTWIDVGTAAMNMMIAAHALGLGSCPVTSFSQAGVAALLELPPAIVPELLLMLGHPSPDRPARPRGARIAGDDLTDWERIGGTLRE